MARFHKIFKTKHRTQEMKSYISTNLLPNPGLSSLLNTTVWEGDNLKVDSKLGNGYIRLSDYQIEVDIDLNFFGSMAQKTLESTLDKEIKLLQ